MPKRGENIYQRKDRRWEGRYIKGRELLTGKAQYGYVYATSYNECKHLKALAETQAKEMAAVNKGLTVAAGLDLWLEEKRAEPSIHKGTLQLYEHHIEKHLKPMLGQAKVHLLSGEVIQRFRLRQLNEGRLDGCGGLSASTVNTQIVILCSMLEYAREHKWIRHLPEFSGKKQTKTTDEREVRVLERYEQGLLEARLIRKIGAESREYRGLCLGVLFALYTGLRVGELGGLQWRDISFDNATVTVRHTLQRIKSPQGAVEKTTLELGTPKTLKSHRSLPMNRTLCQVVENYYNKLNLCERKATDYVFTYRGGPIEPRLFQKAFKRLLREAGVADGNFHCLRHTFATRCLERGMDLQSLSEILGHSDATMTARRYAHALHQHKAECMERLAFSASALLEIPAAISRQAV